MMFAQMAANAICTTSQYEDATVQEPKLHIYDKPPEGAAADWSMPQDWESFSSEDHARWRDLVSRQSTSLKGLASEAFMDGLEKLDLSSGGIPDYREFNTRFLAATGWQAIAVPGVIPNDVFFRHLAERRFPVSNFLRQHSSLDYNDEPDMFHDVFGHLPMFVDRTFGDFMAAYGRAGLRAEKLGMSDLLGRLYLHTVEFGLIAEAGGVRAYGAGLLSSYAETVHAVTGADTLRLKFNLPRMMRTDYPFDTFQPTYFVIESFAALLEEMETTSLRVVYGQMDSTRILAPGESDPSDVVFTVDAV
ncbi:phenylalanine 4-monooxygenase [Qipengyuania sp. DGS5-3]|uniref:phenylalanine 4-monooxygenase n=1 Tax=Qipengyuania sp. DGS5-3 TaxID=3349632 RepID=UPI0036D2D552